MSQKQTSLYWAAGAIFLSILLWLGWQFRDTILPVTSQNSSTTPAKASPANTIEKNQSTTNNTPVVSSGKWQLLKNDGTPYVLGNAQVKFVSESREGGRSTKQTRIQTDKEGRFFLDPPENRKPFDLQFSTDKEGYAELSQRDIPTNLSQVGLTIQLQHGGCTLLGIVRWKKDKTAVEKGQIVASHLGKRIEFKTNFEKEKLSQFDLKEELRASVMEYFLTVCDVTSAQVNLTLEIIKRFQVILKKIYY